MSIRWMGAVAGAMAMLAVALAGCGEKQSKTGSREWAYGTTCDEDDSVTDACSDDTYGYVCAIGDDPTSMDPTLNCSVPVGDPDGVDDDFCCE